MKQLSIVLLALSLFCPIHTHAEGTLESYFICQAAPFSPHPTSNVEEYFLIRTKEEILMMFAFLQKGKLVFPRQKLKFKKKTGWIIFPKFKRKILPFKHKVRLLPEGTIKS